MSKKKIRKKFRNKSSLGWILLVIADSILIPAGGIWFAGRSYYKERYYPGTVIDGYACGQKTPEIVYKHFDKEAEKYQITIKADTEEVLSDQEYGFIQSPDKSVYDKILEEQDEDAWFLKIKSGQQYAYRTDGEDIDKDRLRQAIRSLDIMNPEEVIKPVDASIRYDDSNGKYVAEPEKNGNTFDEEKVCQKITEAVEERKDSVDITEYYTQAKVTTENSRIKSAVKQLNTYLKTELTYSAGTTRKKLTKEEIRKFINWTKDFNVSLNEEELSDYVASIASTFNTVGKTRTINSPGSGTFNADGGTYGWIVSKTKEKEQLKSDITEGKTVTREPCYSFEAQSHTENGDVGNTYIDVNITKQMLYFVKNGSIVLQTDIVTGNLSTGHATPTGTYYIEYKTTDYTMKKYNSHVDYWMPFDTSTGVGLHDADWRSEFGGDIYKTSGSHGCVNIPPAKAKEIYEMAYVNMPVVVH